MQNAFIGLPADDRLIRIATQVSRTADPRFPRKPLNPEDWEEIAQISPRLRSLDALKEALRGECLMTFGMVKLAEHDGTTALQRAADAGVAESARAALKEMADSDLLEPTGLYACYHTIYLRYEETRRRLKNLRYSLEDQFLEVKRKRFLESAPVDDIRRQLHGLPSTVPVPSPDQNTFRSRLAIRLFTSEAPTVGSDEDISRRIVALKEFNAHRSRQEPKAPRRRNPGQLPKQDRSQTTESETAESEIGWVFPSDSEWAKSDTSEPDYPDSETSEPESGCVPMVLPSLTCIHCLFDPGNKDRRWAASRLSRKDALRRHAQRHFKYYEESNIPMKCPHERCAGREPMTTDHYKIHAANVHKVFY